MGLIIELMEKCDLLSISDGVDPYRYAVAFAFRNGSTMDYIQGNDLEALLDTVLKMYSPRATE